LAYCTRPNIHVPAEPTLATNQPFSEEHGSVEAELIARASYAHPLFQQDNAAIYYGLEEATRGMIYAASIKPFQRTKDGRGALAAMISQCAGEDKWRALIKQAEDLIHARRWKGQQYNDSLEKFIGQHRTAFVNMSQCATYVNYQLPNATSRITNLLTGIECMSPPLQAAMALVRSDQGPNGKMNDFEATASFLLPHDPIATKRHQDKKRPAVDISEVNASQRGDDHTKARTGKTGVEFRFHTYDEYNTLTKEQKEELDAYRDSREAQGLSRKLPKYGVKGNKGKKSFQKKATSPPPNRNMKKMIAAAVAEYHSKDNEVSVDQQLHDYIVSVVQTAKTNKSTRPGATGQAAAVESAPATPQISRKSILNRAKK
jgi:hypothetical protein